MEMFCLSLSLSGEEELILVSSLFFFFFGTEASFRDGCFTYLVVHDITFTLLAKVS